MNLFKKKVKKEFEFLHLESKEDKVHVFILFNSKYKYSRELISKLGKRLNCKTDLVVPVFDIGSGYPICKKVYDTLEGFYIKDASKKRVKMKELDVSDIPYVEAAFQIHRGKKSYEDISSDVSWVVDNYRLHSLNSRNRELNKE